MSNLSLVPMCEHKDTSNVSLYYKKKLLTLECKDCGRYKLKDGDWIAVYRIMITGDKNEN
jgi:hypothetical protein